MVDWRRTWCGIHWLGWVSFATLIIGVAGMMSAIALPYFYQNTGAVVDGQNNPRNVYVGLWTVCSTNSFNFRVGKQSIVQDAFACLAIDASCNTWDGIFNVFPNCSKFHGVIACLMLACLFGGLAIFVNWAALAIMLAHGSISTFVVKTGGFALSIASGVLGLVAMILAADEANDLFSGLGTTTYHASFAVLIIGWIFVLISALTFALSARRCGGGFNTDGDSGQKGNFTDDV